MTTLLRRPEVLGRIGVKTTRLYEMVGNGEFPPPVRLGSGRAVAWVASEVEDWIARQIEARSAHRAASAA